LRACKWICGTKDPNPLELDASLKALLREHRNVLTSDKTVMASYRSRVFAAIQPAVSPQLASRLESKLVPVVVKPLLQLAVDLSSAKQFRDFPLDLLTQFGLPLRKFGFRLQDCEVVFTALAHTSTSAEFTRFMQGVTMCIVRIFEKAR